MNNVLSSLKNSSPICSSGAAQWKTAKDCLQYAASRSELWFGSVHTCSMIPLRWNGTTNRLKNMIYSLPQSATYISECSGGKLRGEQEIGELSQC